MATDPRAIFDNCSSTWTYFRSAPPCPRMPMATDPAKVLATAPVSPHAPEHLCVLVHGLWGNPNHLEYVSTELRAAFPRDKLHILLPKNNTGSFTYDGIELGGERVAHEIEVKLDALAQEGHAIQRISIIGYSLGGLIARYAIGLLFHKGMFSKIEPVNFTTFATPHLGVRTPLTGTLNHVWNVLGARTLSMSGRQLFTIDKFRDTGRPLLAVLADPESIFVQALAQFKHRSLYANIVNDHSVTYYTAGISRINPFVDLSAIKVNYLPGYDPVILDPNAPVSAKEDEALPVFTQRLTTATRTLFNQIPFFMFYMLFIPLGGAAFLINSAIQSMRSHRRIQLHEQGKAGIDIGGYRMPLINNMRREVETIFENVNSAQSEEYLPPGSEEAPLHSPSLTRLSSSTGLLSDSSETDVDSVDEMKAIRTPEFPTLALTPAQFAMIEALDNVGFDKYPVWIHRHRHSHAAIIRRYERAAFEEGRVVVKHWLSNFEL